MSLSINTFALGAIVDFANIIVNVTEGDASPFSLCIELRDDGDGLQRPVSFTVILDPGMLSLSLSFSLSLSHSFSLSHSITLYTTLGTVDVVRDINLAAEFILFGGAIFAFLQFLPNNATTLCLDFTVVDDDLIESTESFQVSLQPVLVDFGSTQSVISNSSVYIADNDGKFDY